MNSMRRLAVICMLALGLLSAGMAQSQGRLVGQVTVNRAEIIYTFPCPSQNAS